MSTQMRTHSSSSTLSPTKIFEIKLCSGLGKNALIFATLQPDEDAAADFGRAMLERHHNFDLAEIWQGMKMLRQV